MEHKPLKAGTLIKLKWLDSKATAGWMDVTTAEKVNDLPVIESVGFVVSTTPARVMITSSVCAELGHFIDPLSIPFGAITELTELQP